MYEDVVYNYLLLVEETFVQVGGVHFAVTLFIVVPEAVGFDGNSVRFTRKNQFHFFIVVIGPVSLIIWFIRI